MPGISPPAWSVRNPPMSGPSTLAIPNVAPTKPWYFPRTAGGKRSAMTMKAIAKRPAPPSPCTARKTMSWFIPSPRSGSGPNSPASPHSAEPSEEKPDGPQLDPLARVRVGELAVDRHHHRRGEEVGRGDPRVARDAVEVFDDAREGGRDDGLVEGAEEESEQDARERERAVARGEIGHREGRGEKGARGTSAMTCRSVARAELELSQHGVDPGVLVVGGEGAGRR